MNNCEPSGPESEHLFDSLIHAHKRLRELGFIYNNGKVTIIEQDEDSSQPVSEGRSEVGTLPIYLSLK